MLKGYTTVQLVFVRDMNLPIKNQLDWGLVCQRNQMQINRDKIGKNNIRVDHNYKVIDKVMLTNNAEYKYEIKYNETFLMMQG